MRNICLAAVMAFGALTTQATADFRLSVSGWGEIPLCTNGRPNVVGNPEFVLTDIPPETTDLVFELVDLNVPNYDHGGGTVTIGAGVGDTRISSETFTYRSPCPPGRTHTYEWRVTAMAGRSPIASSAARLNYP